MIRLAAREALWLGGAVLATGATIAGVAIWNGASTALDVFAGFLSIVDGVVIYAVAGVARFALGRLRDRIR